MGIVAEIVAGAKSYRNIKWNIASFSLFCLGPAGVFLAYFADPAAWAETMLNNGTSQEYIDMMTALDIEVSKLKIMKADHNSKQFRLEDSLLKYFPEKIEEHKGFVRGLEADMQTLAAYSQSCDLELHRTQPDPEIQKLLGQQPRRAAAQRYHLHRERLLHRGESEAPRQELQQVAGRQEEALPPGANLRSH